jgi:hypothetical protein
MGIEPCPRRTADHAEKHLDLPPRADGAHDRERWPELRRCAARRACGGRGKGQLQGSRSVALVPRRTGGEWLTASLGRLNVRRKPWLYPWQRLTGHPAQGRLPSSPAPPRSSPKRLLDVAALTLVAVADSKLQKPKQEAKADHEDAEHDGLFVRLPVWYAPPPSASRIRNVPPRDGRGLIRWLDLAARHLRAAVGLIFPLRRPA